MPSRTPKACSYPGCTALVRSGRCDAHAAATIQRPRDREVQRLYDRRWQQRRVAQLAMQPWCEECLRANVYTPAVDVHHVIPHRGNAETFVSSPLQSLCKACHTRKTVVEAQGKGGSESFVVGVVERQGPSARKNIPT